MFARVRTVGRWVHPGSLGALGLSLVVVGFNLVCCVHPVSLCSLGFALGVLGFISGFRRGNCVHSGLPGGHPGSFGSLGFALEVVGFIRGLWVHSGSL